MKNLSPRRKKKFHTAWNIKHDSKGAIQNRKKREKIKVT